MAVQDSFQLTRSHTNDYLVLVKQRLFFSLSMAARQLNRRAETNLPQGIGLTQCGVLFALGGQTSTLAKIASEIGVSKPAMSELAKRMELAGTITRLPDPDDKRGRLLKLTPAGLSIRSEALATLNSLNEQVSAEFSDEELAIVARWLRSVAQPDGINRKKVTDD